MRDPETTVGVSKTYYEELRKKEVIADKVAEIMGTSGNIVERVRLQGVTYWDLESLKSEVRVFSIKDLRTALKDLLHCTSEEVLGLAVERCKQRFSEPSVRSELDEARELLGAGEGELPAAIKNLQEELSVAYQNLEALHGELEPESFSSNEEAVCKLRILKARAGDWEGVLNHS